MKFQGEVPPVENRRVGPGWWMDESGRWQPPEVWPEDYPPIRGWLPDPNGGWRPPGEEELRRREDTRWARHLEMQEPPRQSRQAQADKRDMLLVTGAILAVLVVLVGALILINQAGASDDDQPDVGAADVDEVIYPGETAEVLAARRSALAAQRPAWASETLALLPTAAPAATAFDEADWRPPEDDCVSSGESALIARSADAVAYADRFECVLDAGRWYDRYLDQELRRAIEVEALLRVPLERVHAAGGWEWDRATREAYVGDIGHPAMYEIVAAGSGHNPRAQDPSEWRPASRTTWCAYAVDWIAVKFRWSLAVTTAERTALEEMLATCADPESAGADPATTPLEEPARPTIVFRSL